MRKVLIGLFLMVGVSGCEIGFKTYAVPVDEHTESTSMKRLPIKCYIMNCSEAEVKGS